MNLPANPFFEKPILNSPYAYPKQHWELDGDGQPTQKILGTRRPVSFITPIPKPRKRKDTPEQQGLVFNEGKGVSTQDQQYDTKSLINEVRVHVDRWRLIPNPNE